MDTPPSSPAVQPSLTPPTSSSSSSLQPVSEPQLPHPHIRNPPAPRPGTPSLLPATHPTSPQSQQQGGPQPSAQQTAAARPWWRPPARNYRLQPGNHAIDPYFTSTTLAVSQSAASQLTSSSESLLHYWFRALNYIIRIPFRELIGHVSLLGNPNAAVPLADVPLNATILTTQTNQVFTNSYAGQLQSDGGNLHVAEALARAAVADSETAPPQTTTRSQNYIPQIKKAWSGGTLSMSWALSTAFFTSFICTVVAIDALVANWNVKCTYLRVFLVLFVLRKWTVSFLMMDRALYRLPLRLVEPDPDIDEERHHGIAMYMSFLFTWHGYAMLFGSFYVFFYGNSHYMASAPVITGVAVAFSCMGLVPFFALLSMILSALVLLYVVCLLFVCLIWHLEKCGLSRRRAVSQRNGGYRSNGTTNTTDLRQVERAIEDEENGEGGGAGFGRTNNIKETPAMACIPIVIFRKPKIQGPSVSPECADLSSVTDSTACMDRDYVKSEIPNFQSSIATVETVEDTIDPTPAPGKSSNLVDRDSRSGLSLRSSLEQQGGCSWEHKVEASGDFHVTGDQPVVIIMELINGDNHSNVISKTSSILTTTQLQSWTPETRSRASSSSFARIPGEPWMTTIVPQDLPSTSFMPCAAGQETSDTEGCVKYAASISIPATDTPQSPQPMCRDSLSKSSTDNTTASDNGKSNVGTASKSGACPKIPVDDYPTIMDEECAICLSNFEDGDELRHLYCNHFFHRGCVDRWLAKSPFCPKCKRGI